MDVQKKLDDIVATVGGARSMPMSASCVVNRAELLAMLEEVRAALPGSLAQAQELLGGREQMVEEARAEAERIIETAHAHRGSLISDTEVARQSQDEADRILAEARREAEEIRAEADDYVDSKLANFEVVLTKTIGSVDRGREKLLGRDPGLDDQGYPDEDGTQAPERSADPETLRQRADAYVDAKFGAFQAVLTKTLEAVGRGRDKLQGAQAIDELGAHLAAQGDPQSGHQADAEYLAGLAGIGADQGSSRRRRPRCPRRLPCPRRSPRSTSSPSSRSFSSRATTPTRRSTRSRTSTAISSRRRSRTPSTRTRTATTGSRPSSRATTRTPTSSSRCPSSPSRLRTAIPRSPAHWTRPASSTPA